MPRTARQSTGAVEGVGGGCVVGGGASWLPLKTWPDGLTRHGSIGSSNFPSDSLVMGMVVNHPRFSMSTIAT